MKIETVYRWPEWLLKTLPPRQQKKISPQTIRLISRCQLDLWKALNIYDDFLDGDGEPEKLPLANTAYRRFLETYHSFPLSPAFYHLFNNLLSRLDKANRQEALIRNNVFRGRHLATLKNLPAFDDLEKLADKSLALALGPLAIAEMTAEKNDQKQQGAILAFFRSVLAAKQLADDSHDWLEDLSSGQITAVSTLLLKAAQRRRINLDQPGQPEIVYLLFAQEAAPIIMDSLGALCLRARRQAAKAGWNQEAALVRKLLNPLEKALGEATSFRNLLLEDKKKML